jgi:TatD DNase family protein
MDVPQTIGYTLRGNRYLNVTNRCTLRCVFCPKFNGRWDVRDYYLRLKHDPSVDEMIEAVGDPTQYHEIVFCGMGEPTLRLYALLDVARAVKARGGRARVNTDGLVNLVYGRDVTPDFEGLVDALSVSMNAQDAATYSRHCRPSLAGSYDAMLDFVARARQFVPEVSVTAIDGLAGVDIIACKQRANALGVKFRRRVLDIVG